MKRKAAARDEAPDGDDAPAEAFDEEEATRQAKRMKSEELRAALEAAGVEDTDGNKPALVERLVATQRVAASADGEATTPTPAEAEAPAPSRKRKGPPVLYSAPARQPAKLTRAAGPLGSCANVRRCGSCRRRRSVCLAR